MRDIDDLTTKQREVIERAKATGNMGIIGDLIQKKAMMEHNKASRLREEKFGIRPRG